MHRSLKYAAAILFAALATGSAQEWPRFRGPNGSGLAPALDIPLSFTEKDFAWKVTLPGAGHSSPVLWGERLFVTSADKSGSRFVCCLHIQDGRELWRRAIAGSSHRMHADNSFASATPAVDPHNVYLSFGNAKEFLVLAMTHEGKEIWRTDLGPYQAGHGFGGSIIVHDGVVLLANEQNGPSSLVGLECGSGKVLWKSPRQSKSHYATPCIFQPRDRPAEAIFASYEHGMTSLNPKTGAVNWELDIFFKDHVESSIASPITGGDLIFATCGWLGVNYETVAVRPYAADAQKPAMAYRVTKTAPLVPTPLVKGDLLFLLSDRGILTCVDAQDGKELWRERVIPDCYSSPICVGNHLYCISRGGEVVVVAAARNFEVLGRSQLDEGTHATPAVGHGRIYLRTFSQVLAIGK